MRVIRSSSSPRSSRGLHAARFSPHLRKPVHSSAPGGGADPGKSRPLNLAAAKDRTILLELLARRAPVSPRLGVVRESAAFLFATAGRPLRYIPALDCVVFGELKESGAYELWDVVAPSMPAFADLVDHLPDRWTRLEVYFCPDQLGAEFVVEPHVLDTDGPDLLMVRGPYRRGRSCSRGPRARNAPSGSDRSSSGGRGPAAREPWFAGLIRGVRVSPRGGA